MMNSLIKSVFKNPIGSVATLLSGISQRHLILNSSKCLLPLQFSTLNNSTVQKTGTGLLKNVNNIMEQQTRDYKVKMRLRKRCKSCQFQWRNGRIYVDCKTYPSHKQHHKFSLERGYDHLAHGYHDSSKKKHSTL